MGKEEKRGKEVPAVESKLLYYSFVTYHDSNL